MSEVIGRSPISTGLFIPHDYDLNGCLVTGSDRHFNIHESGTVQNHPLGSRLVHYSTTRAFRYVKFTAALNAGLLCGYDYSTRGEADINDIINGNHAIGARTVRLSNSALSGDPVNKHAGGLLMLTGSGEGVYYILASSAAVGNAVELLLADPLVSALTTGSDAAIVPTPWDSAEPCAVSGADAKPIGVALVDQANGDFGWVQTWGPARCIAEVAITQSQNLTTSDAVVGEVQPKDAETEITIGYSLFDGDADGGVGVYLRLSP